jgi:hypothetical protein
MKRVFLRGRREFCGCPQMNIPKLVAELRGHYDAQISRKVSFRIQQLRQLFSMVEKEQARILEALKQDLRKPAAESYSKTT